MLSGIEYGELDVTKFFNTKYNYQLIDENALDYDFFHFNAKDFTYDIHIGFSNGFNGHNDKKWEIVLGGWAGKQHVIRDQNQKPARGLARITNYDRYSLFFYTQNTILLSISFQGLNLMTSKKTSSSKFKTIISEFFFRNSAKKKNLSYRYTIKEYENQCLTHWLPQVVLAALGLCI